MKRLQGMKNQHRIMTSYTYTLQDRLPFFDLARKYLPTERDAILIDIGAGDGYFARHLGLENYSNCYLLDGNEATVKELRKDFPKSRLYIAPGQLPFEDGSVSFIHCSHLVEHLSSVDLYQFLTEIDRTLSDSGILVISTPMLWGNFYNDLTHVRPYNPSVFTHYLCENSPNRSKKTISNKYAVVELVYRYAVVEVSEGFHSASFVIDTLLQAFKRLTYRLGLKKYQRNGYTLVLRKSCV